MNVLNQVISDLVHCLKSFWHIWFAKIGFDTRKNYEQQSYYRYA